MVEFDVTSMEPHETTIITTHEDGSESRRLALRIPLRDDFPIEEVTE